MRWVALVGLLVLSVASTEAQTQIRQVLVLQSFDRGILVLDYMTGNLRVDLDEQMGRPVNVVQSVVSPTGAIGAPSRSRRLPLKPRTPPVPSPT